MMNRRRFLALLPVPFLPTVALAEGDDIGIPVEPCPCCCSDDGGVTFYSCDDFGAPLPGDPANCGMVIEEPEECPVDSEAPVFVDEISAEAPTEATYPQITQLPSTGTGASLSTGRAVWLTDQSVYGSVAAGYRVEVLENAHDRWGSLVQIKDAA